jgi:hypothetical protein
MQMMTRSTLSQVKIFLHNPTQHTLQELLAVPALYTILELEHVREGKYALETLGVIGWMYHRGKEVMDGLLGLNLAPLSQLASHSMPMEQRKSEIRDWEKVCDIFVQNYTQLRKFQRQAAVMVCHKSDFVLNILSCLMMARQM